MAGGKIGSRIAVYPGTFDPITNGHIDIIRRALRMFDSIIIAVGDNVSKKPLFSPSERTGMIEKATKGMSVRVETFSGLLVDYVKSRKCSVIIRSLRAVSDFDYEFQMAVMNREQDGDIETVFLMTDKEYFYLSSGLAKQIAQRGGRLSGLVPKNVEQKLREKLGK
jgi:pantetheine-phosphate adenylyltransferase